MKLVVVLTFDVPTPEHAPGILAAIDPPRLPFFTGHARLTPDPYATTLERWLDGDDKS